jgi:acyl dehydratase
MTTSLWFEDFTPGRSFRTAGATISEASILDFAFKFDPQPFHLDKTAAEKTIYGGLIASGFQTMIVAFRLWHAENVMNACSAGSPGIDELRWLKPVRPGDTIHVEVEVLDSRPSRSKPDRGSTQMRYDVFNQEGEKVMSWKCWQLFLKRPEEDRKT